MNKQKHKDVAIETARRVLIVEDDEGLNHLAQKTLRRAGFHTQGVLTGADAIDRAKGDPDVVLLLDQQLPDMEGTELIQTLMKQDLDVPFVAVTGQGDEKIAVEMMKLGARDYLVKGLDLTDLLPGVFERVFREIETDRKLALAEKELQHREERYKLLFNSGNDAVFVQKLTDGRSGLFSEVNDIACAQLGYRREELLGMTCRDVDDADREEDRRLAHDQLMATGRCVFETIFISKSGKRIPVELSCRKFHRNGYPYVLSVARDITERVQAQEALQESEEKYRSMMEAMDDATYICSSDFVVEYMNPAMIKQIGRDVTGERCYRAIHGRDEQCTWCNHEKVMQGESSTGEFHSPVTGRSYHVSHSPLFHADGSISKLTTFRDVSEFKKMEDRMQQVQRLESIGNLAGGIAHDFNNILSPIVGLAEMLREDLPADSFERESADEIFKSAMRARDLVKQILSFSRQGENEKLPIRIQKILTEVIKLMRSMIPSNIGITHSIQSDCGPVLSDPTQVHQIAMNLITNAYHAVEEEGGDLTIRLDEKVIDDDDLAGLNLAPGRYAVLSISDTGHGIDSALLNKIFDPYFTTKAPGKGTGLGLSVVYGIVKEHGGGIRVRSQAGQGATFDVLLPIRTDYSERTPSAEDAVHDLSGSERILLVDDDEAVLGFVTKMLERFGYRVEERLSSIDALKAFKADPARFDLVITDMTMPHMTGDRLAKELMAIRPDLPVVICTGFSERINPEQVEAAGIKGLLMKPVAVAEMAHMVRKVLDGGLSSVKIHPSG